jgi:uncharacterized membrane protein SirB2
MIEFYPQIKSIHVWMVLLSGTVFALRGAGVLLAARWPMALPVRIASYAIDTTLLTAALMLLTMLPTSIFANGWLAVKLALLCLYIIFGTLALKRARSPRLRAAFYVLALLTYAWMLTIARSHHPLGVFGAYLA